MVPATSTPVAHEPLPPGVVVHVEGKLCSSYSRSRSRRRRCSKSCGRTRSTSRGRTCASADPRTPRVRPRPRTSAGAPGRSGPICQCCLQLPGSAQTVRCTGMQSRKRDVGVRAWTRLRPAIPPRNELPPSRSLSLFLVCTRHPHHRPRLQSSRSATLTTSSLRRLPDLHHPDRPRTLSRPSTTSATAGPPRTAALSHPLFSRPLNRPPQIPRTALSQQFPDSRLPASRPECFTAPHMRPHPRVANTTLEPHGTVSRERSVVG